MQCEKTTDTSQKGHGQVESETYTIYINYTWSEIF